MFEKNRNDGQKVEGSVSFFNHCFELISLFCLKKKKKKIPESLCKYSSPLTSVLQSPNRPRIFQESSCILQKKRNKNKDKEDRVYFGTLLQWLWANVMDEHMTVNKKNEVLF